MDLPLPPEGESPDGAPTVAKRVAKQVAERVAQHESQAQAPRPRGVEGPSPVQGESEAACEARRREEASPRPGEDLCEDRPGPEARAPRRR
jgi:hypothetical protein